MWNPSTCDCECNKVCETGEYLDIKNCLCLKILIGTLVLECDDVILNKPQLMIKKVEYAESNCFIQTISLILTCFLLLAITCFSCYFYYTRDWIKKKT